MQVQGYKSMLVSNFFQFIIYHEKDKNFHIITR